MLVFSTEASSGDVFQCARAEIQKSLRDIYNRIQSILFDVAFLDGQIKPCFPDFPVVANQRAGAWYVDPRGGNQIYAYFKSTDGHAGVHDFNLRRANLALIPLFPSCGGILLIDSTRRGKRFPDALSKTVPAWCAVLNAARVHLFPPKEDNSDATEEDWLEHGKLWTLPTAVSRSEHSQIEAKVANWTERLLNSTYDLTCLSTLRKPIRPIFVSPASNIQPISKEDGLSFYAFVVCSVSKLPNEEGDISRSLGFNYIQGSGDDHETWSKGLEPSVFWKNYEEIVAASAQELDSVVASILATQKLTQGISDRWHQIRQTGLTFCATVASEDIERQEPCIFLTSKPIFSNDNNDTFLRVQMPTKLNKNGMMELFRKLPECVNFATRVIHTYGKCRVAAEGDVPSDVLIAVLLPILAFNYNMDEQVLSDSSQINLLSKEAIRGRLHWILEVQPTLNPHRTVLNRLNEYIMSSR